MTNVTCDAERAVSGVDTEAEEMTDLLTALRTTVIAARQRGTISDDEWDEHFADRLADPLAERARDGENP